MKKNISLYFLFIIEISIKFCVYYILNEILVTYSSEDISLQTFIKYEFSNSSEKNLNLQKNCYNQSKKNPGKIDYYTF